jgi:hypothetical protein
MSTALLAAVSFLARLLRANPPPVPVLRAYSTEAHCDKCPALRHRRRRGTHLRVCAAWQITPGCGGCGRWTTVCAGGYIRRPACADTTREPIQREVLAAGSAELEGTKKCGCGSSSSVSSSQSSSSPSGWTAAAVRKARAATWTFPESRTDGPGTSTRMTVSTACRTPSAAGHHPRQAAACQSRRVGWDGRCPSHRGWMVADRPLSVSRRDRRHPSATSTGFGRWHSSGKPDPRHRSSWSPQPRLRLRRVIPGRITTRGTRCGVHHMAAGVFTGHAWTKAPI